MRSLLLYLYIVFYCSIGVGQAEFCADAEQLCFGSNFSVPTNLNNIPEPYNYQCLSSFTPNITWFKIEIASTTGSLDFEFISTSNINLNFIIWGPTTPSSSICQNLTPANLVACDNNSAPGFQISIPTVNQGDIFLIGVMNYANVAGNVYIQPTAANQTYLLCDNIDANVINVNAEFCTGSMDGMIELSPQGGQNGPYDVSLNGTDYGNVISIGSLQNGSYTIGITDINFNANPNADIVEIDLLNVNCTCSASVGQIEVDFEGVSNDSVKMCINDKYNIDKISGQAMPPNETGGSNSFYDTIPYAPAVLMLVYSAPPNTGVPAQNDPNYDFWLPQSVDPSFTFENDALFNSIVTAFGIPNNEFYVVPATVYYHVGNGDFVTCVMHGTCFDYGTVYKVQLLEELVTTVVSEDCANDSMYLEVNGGYSGFYPTYPYTTGNINPPTITMPNSVNVNVPFQVSNFGGFTNYTFTVTDSASCADTVTTKFGFPNYQAAFNDTVYCLSDSSAQVNISNLPAGISQNFSSPNLVIDANGSIDIAASGSQASGTFIINLNRISTGCEFNDTLSISIQANPEIDSLSDESLCSGELFEPAFSSPTANVSYGLFTNTSGFGIPASDSGLVFSYLLENTGGNDVTFPINYFSWDGNCASDTLLMNLTLFNGPDVVDSIIICPGDDLDLQLDNVNTVEWLPEENFSDPTSSFTTYTAGVEDMIYINSSTDNCNFEDTIRITRPLDDDCVPEPYTAFSPNGDGQNDIWTIPGIENYPENEITIFNRWGDVVADFENYNNANVSWDGSNNGNELPAGTYFYTIEYTNELKSQGWVKLIK